MANNFLEKKKKKKGKPVYYKVRKIFLAFYQYIGLKKKKYNS